MSHTSSPADKLLSTIGLCARARKLVIGTPMVCDALRTGGKTRVLAVLKASDTSSNTSDRLASKCAFYHVPLYRIPADTLQLGRAVGKTGPVAAVGLTDSHMFHALEQHLPAPSPTRHTATEAIPEAQPGAVPRSSDTDP